MAQYLVIKNNNNSTKQYECKDSPIGAPYLKVNSKAIDLTTKTSARFDLCVKPKVTSIKEQVGSEYTYNTTDYKGYIGLGLATLTTGYIGVTSGTITYGYSGLVGYSGTSTFYSLSEKNGAVNKTSRTHSYYSTTGISSDYYAGTSKTIPFTQTGSIASSNKYVKTSFPYFVNPDVSKQSIDGNTSVTTNIDYNKKTFSVNVSLSNSGAWDMDGMFKTGISAYNYTIPRYSSYSICPTSYSNVTTLTSIGTQYKTSSTTNSILSSTTALTKRNYTNITNTTFMFLNNASNITSTVKRTSYGYLTTTKTANTSMVYRPALYSSKNLEKISESTISYSGSIKTTSSYAKSLMNFSGQTSIVNSKSVNASIYTLWGGISEIAYYTRDNTVSSSSSTINSLSNGTYSITSYYDSNGDIPVPVYKGTGTIYNFSIKDKKYGVATYSNCGTSYTTTSSAYCSGTWRGLGGVGYPYTSYGGEYGIGNSTSVDWVNQRATCSAWLGEVPEQLLSGVYSYGSASTTTSALYSTRRYCKFTVSSSGLISSTVTNLTDCKFKPEDIISSATSTTYNYLITSALSTFSNMWAFYDNGRNIHSFILRYLHSNYVTSSSYVTLKSTAAATNNMSSTYAFVKTYNNNLGTTLITY